jgi:hypothetical protein
LRGRTDVAVLEIFVLRKHLLVVTPRWLVERILHGLAKQVIR